jgi:hypothetical protein
MTDEGRTVPPTLANGNGDFEVPTVAVVNLDDVEVPSFQRGRQDKWAKEIAENWNPLLFRPPLLARRADGKLDIIDGQHTIEAVRLRGHTKVPAFVRDGLDAEAEAGTFADLNTKRRGLRPYEIWKAEASAGRPWAVKLDEVARRNGLKVAHEREPTALACIGECRKVLRKDNGAELLDGALYVLTRTWEDLSDPANETRVERGLVTGMVDLIERVNKKGLFDKDGWVEKLKTATFKTSDGTVVKVTPRSFPSYVASLIEKGAIQLTSIQTGSGQSVIQGKALAYLIFGPRRAPTFYK